MLTQKEAIEKLKGPCLILAGAGTGKTYTIVEKIKHILNKKAYNPEKIVCLTFSNEAVNSLRTRILHLTKDKEPIIKTFHSFCADLLRKHGEKINLKEDFKILLPDDAKIMLHKNFRVQPYDCHKYVSAISNAKDLGISTEDLENYLKDNLEDPSNLEKTLEDLQFKHQMLQASKEETEEIKEKIESLTKLHRTNKFLQTWKIYEKIKEKKGFLDYSDLNKKALELLTKFPEIAKEFDYIIVDEFQDTNKLQCDFLEKLSPEKNITVVGDLNQSIYRFRGAYKENLSNFKKTFNVKETFALDKSYRSTNKILDIAHQLILNNYQDKNEVFKVFNAFNQEGNKIKCFELEDNKEETRKIVEIIKEELKNTSPEEICVMFRTHQQARMLKNSLEFENIPYTSVTQKPLLKIQPIKIARSYLTILSKLKSKSKGGEKAWWDLIHNSEFSKEDSIVISRYIKENREENISIKILNSKDINLSEDGKTRLNLLLTTIKKLIPETEKPVPELILKIYEASGLSPKEESSEKEKLLLLQKFHSLALEYSQIDSPDISSFVHHLDIIDALGIEIPAPSLNNSGIRIMTHHATKGLEYQTVIVTNLAQRRFPMERIEASLIPSELSPELAPIIKDLPDKESAVKLYEQKNQLLEERRLCYVAFTRAKNNLYLTYAKKYGNKKHPPSQFLNEIDHKKNPKIDFKEDKETKYSEPTINQEIAPITTPEITFSPSRLQKFEECQKAYEYRYIYNMPDPEPVSWDLLKLGSFVHEVFEKGVKSVLKTEKEFIDLAKTLQMEEKWNFIELEEALPLIKTFFIRNKNKFNEKSLTEKKLYDEIDGLKFMGVADRIDINGKDELEIVDYKTGSSVIPPRYRNWQLGFYAIASRKFGKPKKLILDMLKKDKPIEFELDDKGTAREIHSSRTSFNLDEVKEEMVETAKKILECHKKGFSPCPIDKACNFCDEYVRGF